MGKTYKATPSDDFDFDDEESFYDLSDEYFADADLDGFEFFDADEDADMAVNVNLAEPLRSHHKNAGHTASRRPEKNAPPRNLPHDWEDFDYGIDASNDDERDDIRWG